MAHPRELFWFPWSPLFDSALKSKRRGLGPRLFYSLYIQKKSKKSKAPLVRRGSAKLPEGTLPFKNDFSTRYKSRDRAEDDGVEP